MTNEAQRPSPTDELSKNLARAVKRSERGVVRVHAGDRSGTSGSVFASDLVISSSAALGHKDHAELSVTTADDQSFAATIVGRDPSLDLALLRVEGAALAPLEFAASDGLEVGQLALALGRPGRAIRASLRIIGLLARDVATPHGGRLARYIESDRGLPEGFLGGPLIDLAGNALGMNTTRVLRGSDLTLPLEVLEPSVNALRTHGSVARGRLGVAAQGVRLPDALAERHGQKAGAIVLAIESDSAAERAGLVLGDVLLSIDGEALASPHKLRALLWDRAEQPIELAFLRGGELQKLSLRVGASR